MARTKVSKNIEEQEDHAMTTFEEGEIQESWEAPDLIARRKLRESK